MRENKLIHTYLYSSLVRCNRQRCVRCMAISVSVCLSVCVYVCPLAYLKNRMLRFHEIISTCRHCAWLGLTPTTIQRVVYFRFFGCHHVSHNRTYTVKVNLYNSNGVWLWKETVCNDVRRIKRCCQDIHFKKLDTKTETLPVRS